MKLKRMFTGILAACLCLATVVAPVSANAGTLKPAPTPVIFVTGTEVAAPARYTVAQMKALADVNAASAYYPQYDSSWVYKHSVLDSSGNCRIYSSTGVSLWTLIGNSQSPGLSSGDSITFTASDGTSKNYPYDPGSDALATERFVYGVTYVTPETLPHGVPLIAWSSSYVTLGSANPATKVASSQLPMLLVGQLTDTDVNSPYLFNSSGGATTITVGAPDNSTVLTVNGKAYTALDLLKKAAVTSSFTYSAAGGSKTDYVEGVSLASLLSDVADTATVTFTSADGSKTTTYTMTKAQLVAANAVLAYAVGTNANYQAPVSGGKGYGPSPTLYLDGKAPVTHISVVKSTPAKSTGSTSKKKTTQPPSKNQKSTPSSSVKAAPTSAPASLPKTGDSNASLSLALSGVLCAGVAAAIIAARRRRIRNSY
ncbi:MAG: LPXTG cell wall anchor domain-containing protein [Coriobacteriia bacterium]|nr:LPXTG cell wall anchor domain-containing protein [Coriobacteriia bacterium]